MIDERQQVVDILDHLTGRKRMPEATWRYRLKILPCELYSLSPGFLELVKKYWLSIPAETKKTFTARSVLNSYRNKLEKDV